VVRGRERVVEERQATAEQRISRDKKSGKIVSEAHGHHEGELASDLAFQIIASLQSKSGKNYPSDTMLVI
jgi:hypothetical protein